jgi:hypothetical protein
MQHSVFGHAIVEQLTSDEFQQRRFARASRADEHFDDVFPMNGRMRFMYSGLSIIEASEWGNNVP